MRRRILGSMVATAALLGLLAFREVAVAENEDKRIVACVLDSTGSVRIVDDASECRSRSERAVEWAQTGKRGPAGPPGPSIRYWRPIYNYEPESAAARSFAVEAACPANYIAVSAGWEFTGSNSHHFSITANQPLGERGWRLTVQSIDGQAHTIGANLFLYCQQGAEVGDDDD